MADIKAITGLDSTVYNFRDDYSVWGGNNLLLNIKKTETPTNYLANSGYLLENMVQGDRYTLQLWGVSLSRSDKETPWIRPYWGGGNVAIAQNLYPDANGYCQCTFTAPTSTHSTVTNAFINFYNSPGVGATGTTYNMVIDKWKLEKGDKATDWSPCYKDIFSYDSTNNQLVVNL